MGKRATRKPAGPRPGTMRLGALVGAEYNPRRMSQSELRKLERSIDEFGLVEPVVARPDGLIVGGHQRVAALRSLLLARGLSEEEVAAHEVPVMLVDLDDARAKILNLALNRIQGDWDYDLLSTLLSEMEASATGLEITGFDEGEIADILALVGRQSPDLSGLGDPVDPDAEIAREQRRFSFVVDTDGDAALVREVLGLFGAERPSQASAALVLAMRAARATCPASSS